MICGINASASSQSENDQINSHVVSPACIKIVTTKATGKSTLKCGNASPRESYVEQKGFLKRIRYMISAVAEMKNIFIVVLYTLTKYINKSRYLTQNTIR
jgi:hypothetical protein